MDGVCFSCNLFFIPSAVFFLSLKQLKHSLKWILYALQILFIVVMSEKWKLNTLLTALGISLNRPGDSSWLPWGFLLTALEISLDCPKNLSLARLPWGFLLTALRIYLSQDCPGNFSWLLWGFIDYTGDFSCLPWGSLDCLGNFSWLQWEFLLTALGISLDCPKNLSIARLPWGFLLITLGIYWLHWWFILPTLGFSWLPWEFLLAAMGISLDCLGDFSWLP